MLYVKRRRMVSYRQVHKKRLPILRQLSFFMIAASGVFDGSHLNQ
ncbi:hypothetical protein BAXH7_04038 [Bacillus amyloliquefaciens XH7]|nr:hypothetical protein LL3_04043 [Bacillus amyloliquefaciens LL3]AEK91146.1 hypothetical protein BAXH7_04038 [Bacillus amyloliquefaciens XH7]KYC98707.1 hypothetical protein B425_3170 [Bacillus amyloliquefaciens]QBG58382.1 hypothetical protein D2M30_4083 [Bacillus amyloliquefaciens]